MKKFLPAVLALALLLLAPAAWAAFDDTGVKTKHIVLMEANSGTVLYEKAAQETAFPASTTKIMTCILALENGNLDDTVTVPSVTESGSCMKIRRGEKLSLRSLIYGMMLISGNDAAEAVAVHIGGSKADFVAMMNAKASEIGMTNTHYVEPSGLHKEDHVTTAYDMALLTKYALMESPKKDDFRYIIDQKTYTVKDSSRATYELENTNRLLHTPLKSDGSKDTSYEYRYAIGVKTGDTKYAMRCLVAAAEKDGVTLISVQLYDEEAYDRFSLAARLFDYGFDSFTTTSAASLGLQDTVQVKVNNASFEDQGADENGTLTLNVSLAEKMLALDKATLDAIRANASAVETTVITNGDVIAPVQEGDLVATVAYAYEGNILFTANAYASRSVLEMGAAPMEATPLPNIERIDNGSGAGPWLFIVLVLVAILLATGIVFYLRARNKRHRRYSRRRVAYRGRRR